MQNEPLWCSLSSWSMVTQSVSLKGLSCPGSSSSSPFFFLLSLCLPLDWSKVSSSALLHSPPQTTRLLYHSPTTTGTEQTWMSLVMTQISLSSFNHASQIFAPTTKFQLVHGEADFRTGCFNIEFIHSRWHSVGGGDSLPESPVTLCSSLWLSFKQCFLELSIQLAGCLLFLVFCMLFHPVLQSIL